LTALPQSLKDANLAEFYPWAILHLFRDKKKYNNNTPALLETSRKTEFLDKEKMKMTAI
jgi:hypothetical protein